MQDSTQRQSPSESEQGRTLQIDFRWKSFKAFITQKDTPKSRPLYEVDFRATKPYLVLKSGAGDLTIGTGTIHVISINADCELHGRSIKLEAQKRLATEYAYRSFAFSDTDSPVTMNWTGSLSLKIWNFTCLDELQLPVAKFSANIWGIKDLGTFEFMGSKLLSDEMRDEIVMTGLTLYYCMVMRSGNVFSLIGAIPKPGLQGKKN